MLRDGGLSSAGSFKQALVVKELKIRKEYQKLMEIESEKAGRQQLTQNMESERSSTTAG
jgi:hypothetical protein